MEGIVQLKAQMAEDENPKTSKNKRPASLIFLRHIPLCLPFEQKIKISYLGSHKLIQ